MQTGRHVIARRAGEPAKLYAGWSRRARFVSRRQIRGRLRNLRRKTEQHQHPDRLPRQIEFPPFVTVRQRIAVGRSSFDSGEIGSLQIPRPLGLSCQLL
jgi:hypothetical protein